MSSKTFHYKKSRFTTHLPVDYRYSPSHYWAAQVGEGLWRVGFTKFATRMLGDMVDHGFDTTPGAAVELGQTLGWMEGFKAITDLYAVGTGEFVAGNTGLKERVQTVNKKPYDEGWIYELRGVLDERCMDVQAYAQLLDSTIQRILEKESAHESE